MQKRIDAHFQIIREMLRNINMCPKGKCGACEKSVDLIYDQLNLVEEIKGKDIKDFTAVELYQEMKRRYSNSCLLELEIENLLQAIGEKRINIFLKEKGKLKIY